MSFLFRGSYLLSHLIFLAGCSGGSSGVTSQQGSGGAIGVGSGSGACTVGTEACACRADQTCDAGLSCLTGTCSAAAVAGTGGSGTGGGVSVGDMGSTGGGSFSGGAASTGGSVNTGGSASGGSVAAVGGTSGTGTGGAGAETGGADGVGGSATDSESAGACTVGAGVMSGSGSTDAQYQDEDVKRDDSNYMMITNGWGRGWQSHQIAWSGTSMTVEGFEGSRQDNGAPAGYPTVFCGRYSDKTSQECGLPKALDSLTELNTAFSWSHEAKDGTYNVAYDVWLGNGSSGGGGFGGGGGLESYFMIWLHNPDGEGPAGALTESGITVAGIPGNWDLHTGSVNGLPIVNYVRPDGEDSYTMAFDIMDFINDAQARGLEFPGNDVLSVAIGFEIWQGSVTDLKLDDFCVDVQ